MTGRAMSEGKPNEVAPGAGRMASCPNEIRPLSMAAGGGAD